MEEGLDVLAIQEQLRLLGHDIPDSLLLAYLEQLELDGALDDVLGEPGARSAAKAYLDSPGSSLV
jgi:hypothetical protein